MEIVEAIKRGSIYLGYWVCVVGLAVTLSPHGVAHWTFWAVAMTGVAGAGCWTFWAPSPTPVEEGYSPGPAQLPPRTAVDVTSYDRRAQPPAVSGGATRYLPSGHNGDPPHLMK